MSGSAVGPGIAGIWLTPGPVVSSIEDLLLRLATRRQRDAELRNALIEELGRPAKRKDVALTQLGLREIGVDRSAEGSLHIVASEHEPCPWREALLQLKGDCPIGFVFQTWDAGPVAVVHESVQGLPEAHRGAIRSHAAGILGGQAHEDILAAVAGRKEVLARVRKRMQSLDPSVAFSPDGEVRVQLGSISQTTKNLLREGLGGQTLFVLPQNLFENKTNFADIEFLVYLNFFLRQGMRTRFAGTAQQRQQLERLLRLTIFGLFDPGLAEQPGYTSLHQAFAVPDQDALGFFRTCYEKYGVRRGFRPEAEILGIEDYVDFHVCGPRGEFTEISIPGDTPEAPAYTVRVAPLLEGAFEVRIEQPNGDATTKRLVISTTPDVVAPMPPELSEALQLATERPRFGVTPLGTSHGFDPVGTFTSFVIWIDGTGILVDPSPEALELLEQSEVAELDLPYTFLTHAHADHDGGLFKKLLSGSRTTLIASDVVFRTLIEKAHLITDHDFEKEGLVTHVSANPGTTVRLEIGGEAVELATRWNLHPIPTNGFRLTVGGKTFGYSGDTQYDPEMIRALDAPGKLTKRQVDDLLHFFWTPDGQPTVDLLYHEAGIPPIHTKRETLAALPEAVRARTFLVHIADRDVPPDTSPPKPPLFVTHALLPPSDRSRTEILRRSLGLVSYLYDAPSGLLDGLLETARARIFEAGESVLHTGPVAKDEPLNFYVIADGSLAVRDGRRVMTRLSKGDSFGEWGISHQRGFRIADVVATSRVLLLELPESAYEWMVERHPDVEQRIERIRSLMLALQTAQARLVQKRVADPLRGGSVIEEMNTSQLAAFAVFSEIRKYQRGTKILVEGDQAEEFYILLSGHLQVRVGQRVANQLIEGDVFGEIGLLEGGRRTATVEVVSADAEVLSMSREDFERLLQEAPSFSFGIRTVAMRRREMDDLLRD